MKAYRLITEEDTSAFCLKVTKALCEGWELYGSPSYAYDSENKIMRCAQAVVKEGEFEYSPELKLSEI